MMSSACVASSVNLERLGIPLPLLREVGSGVDGRGRLPPTAPAARLSAGSALVGAGEVGIEGVGEDDEGGAAVFFPFFAGTFFLGGIVAQKLVSMCEDEMRIRRKSQSRRLRCTTLPGLVLPDRVTPSESGRFVMTRIPSDGLPPAPH